MKITINTPLHNLQEGQKIKAEVVATTESGSMLLIDGHPVTTDKKLQTGQKFDGVISKVGDKETIVTTVTTNSIDKNETINNNWLQNNGFSIDPPNKAIIEMLRSLKIPLTPELLKLSRKLFDELGISLEKVDLETLGFIISRRLPASFFSLAKQYLKGELNLGNLLSILSEFEHKSLFEAWKLGKLWENILSIIREQQPLNAQSSDTIKEKLAQNLLMQEIISQYTQVTEESYLYFQWPVFWYTTNIPDTLEGEAFFEKSNDKQSGFSLRLFINPPRLGPLEIGFYRIKDALWVHFGSESDTSQEAIRSIFPLLSDSLHELGWKMVKLTTGHKSTRKSFLSPARKENLYENLNKLDIKI